MKPIYLFASLLFCLSSTFSTLHAAENGNIAYAPGSSQFYAGAFPPFPGVYFLSQTGYLHSPDLKDENGDDVPGDFELTAVTETLRFLFVTDKKIAGFGLWGQLIMPIVSIDLTTPNGLSDDATSIADLSVSIGLAKHLSQKQTLALGVDVVAPTGTYDSDELANIGLNYWSIQPVVGYKYFDRAGPELSLGFRTIFNSENDDTNYDTGNQFVLDYAAGWNFNKIKLGVTGYYLQQLTDDEVNGESIDNRRMGFSAGPSLTYSFNPNFHIGIVWQNELYVENNSKGNQFGLNIGTKF